MMKNIDATKYFVDIINVPTYIKALDKKNENIILVHNKVSMEELPDESILFTSPCSQINTEMSVLEVTGSPLKCSFDNSDVLCMSVLDTRQNNWRKEEEKHYPLPADEARHFITNYFCDRFEQHSQENKDVKPKIVWCVCNGKDQQKTVLLSGEQSSECISRSIVTLQGYTARSITNLEDSEMNHMLLKHLELAPGSVQQVKKHVTAIYHLFGSEIIDEKRDSNNDIKSYAYLELKWEKTCHQIPFDNCETKMVIQCLVGNLDSESYSLWDDLLLLELYINTSSQYSSQTLKLNDWLPAKSTLSSDMDLVNLTIEVVHEAHRVPKYEQRDEVVDLRTIVKNAKTRNNLDVTDRLWHIIIQCSTYGALVDCLNSFIAEVAFSQSNVYIAESNETYIARLLRGILAGKSSVPNLTGNQPIEILIELGLEKLRKDYIYVFTNSGLFDEKTLCDLFRFNKSEDSRKVLIPKMAIIKLDCIEKQMKILGQLETLLEILLQVPYNCLTFINETAFNHFLGPDSPIKSFAMLANNKIHDFQAHVPTNEIRPYIESTNLLTWCFTLTSKYPQYSVQSVFHHSKHPLFPPVIYKYDDDNNQEDTDDVYYHCTLMTTVKNFFVIK